MGSFWQDLRYGVRTLAKTPGFTIVATLTLALGVGANTAIFSVIQNLLLRPLPYPEPHRLIEIWNSYMPQVPRAGIAPGDYSDWRHQATTVSEMGAYSEISAGFNLTGESEPQRVLAGYATASLFPMLGVRMTAGRFFVPEEDRAGNAPIVMLGHRLWKSRFASDVHVVGRTITLDNQLYRIVGILPADFELLRWPDLWMPLGQFNDDLSEHIHHVFVAVARLKPGVTIVQARDEMNRLNGQETVAYPDSHKNIGVLVEWLRDPSTARLRSMLLVLFGAVGLVLLIACSNILNLLLVRQAAREQEVAVRTALGASPWRITRQLLTESMLLSFLGGALGLFLAFGGLQIMLALAPAELSVLRETRLNGWVLAFTLVVCLATGLGCGLLPASGALKTNLAGILKHGSKGAGAPGHERIHNLLVVFEFAMALIPLVAAGLLLRSLQNLLQVSPGFQTEHVLSLEVQQPALSFAEYSKMSPEEQTRLAERQSTQFEQIAEKLRALPGASEVGAIDDLPLGHELRHAQRFVIEGQPLDSLGARPVAQLRTVSIGYFSSLRIPLIAGRGFTHQDWTLKNIVINETMARRFWPAGDALSKRINLCSLDPKPCWFSIIGIVGDVHQFGLESGPTFDVYFTGGWTPYFVLRTISDPAELAAAATNVVRISDPTLPVTNVTTMDVLLADSVAPRRFSAVLTTVFAALALLLAAIGIYGVVSYTVSRRTQEIGIRMALGAQQGNVRGMILVHTFKLTLLGVALGFAGAFALARYLTSLLFGIHMHDPITFIGVPLLLVVVAMLASYLPMRRALRVDPFVALRYE